MATENNLFVQIDGKPFKLDKHLKKSNLIEIITNLQEDLTKIKQFTRNQIDYKDTLLKLREENRILKAIVAKDKNFNNKENHDEINSHIKVFKEQAEVRKSLIENYEKKTRNTMQLYEEKIDLLKKQMTDIEKDRETYAEILEKGQKTIAGLKKDIERLKKDKENMEIRHGVVTKELKTKAEAEKQLLVQDKQKVVKEMAVLTRTYIDLDKIRKYLEKNNENLKRSIDEKNHQTELQTNKLMKSFEEKEAKYMQDLRRVQHETEMMVNDADLKLNEVRANSAQIISKYELRLDEALKDNEDQKRTINQLRENEQSLENEIQRLQIVNDDTKILYEQQIKELRESFHSEKDLNDQEMTQIKAKYEKKISDLETGTDLMQNDANLMQVQVTQLQSQNDYMSAKLIEVRLKAEENNKKYLENYNSLKEKVETIRLLYENDKRDLKNELNSKEKLIDDFIIENKKYQIQIKALKYSNDVIKQENEQDLSQIWAKLQNQKDDFADEKEKMKESTNKRIKLLDNEIEQSKQDYMVLENNYNKLLATKQDQDQSNRNLMEKLNQTEQEYQQQIIQLKKEAKKQENNLLQDFSQQSNQLSCQKQIIQDLQDENQKQTLLIQDLQDQINHLTQSKKHETDRLVQKLAETTTSSDQELKDIYTKLHQRDEQIRKLTQALSEQQNNYNLMVQQKQELIKQTDKNNEMVLQDLRQTTDAQKTKYDILLMEVYKELKQQQAKNDDLMKMKGELEEELKSVKQRNSEIIVNITKQKDKFPDEEFRKLIL